MARRVFQSRLSRQPQRRHTQWFRSPDISAAVTLQAATSVLDTIFDPGTQPLTIVRTRGNIWVATDQAAASESWLGAIGFAVVSESAASVGITGIPTPITDKDSDLWYVHEYFAGGFSFQSGTGTQTQRYTRFQFDSKAMRKIGSEERSVTVVENAAAATGFVYILQFATLVKLP